MPATTQIKSSIQLLVEGKDPRVFFEKLVDHLQLANVQVQNFGGNSELRNFLRDLQKAPRFKEAVRSIGIIRDAEGSAERALQSVQGSLRNYGFAVPDNVEQFAHGAQRVGIFLLPGNERSGMLETLLCDSILENPENRCIEDYFGCIASLQDHPLSSLDKARARVYLATKPRPHLSVGLAAKAGYWNLDHEVFKNVRRFLIEL